jgi:hypothetical protein
MSSIELQNDQQWHMAEWLHWLATLIITADRQIGWRADEFMI